MRDHGDALDACDGRGRAHGRSFCRMEATFILPLSVDIRTLARFSSDDSLCERAPSFYHVENLLTLDDDAADSFKSLDVRLRQPAAWTNITSYVFGSMFST